MGIVTEYCDDVSVLMDADAETVMEIYREYSIKDWRRRDEFKQTMCSRSDNPDLIFDLVKYIPLSVWAQGYIDNLTMEETEKRYHEKGHGNTN